MEFAARLQVTSVVHRIDDEGGRRFSVSAGALGPQGDVNLYLELAECDFEPGDYIEITGSRSRP